MVLSERRGYVTEIVPRQGTPLSFVKGFLPFAESSGFVRKFQLAIGLILSALLRMRTAGQAFPQLVFHHWEEIPDDPLQPGTL
jgi:elongation factor 2